MSALQRRPPGQGGLLAKPRPPVLRAGVTP